MTISRDEHRVSFRVDDPELLFEFRALLEHGQQKLIFNSILRDLVRLLKSEKRHIIIGLLTSGDLHLEDISRKLIKHRDELEIKDN